MKRESKYQRDLVDRIRTLLPGCHIQRNNPDEIQGVPDILILYNDRWAMLEIKKSSSAATQPNQEYYVTHFNTLSFASFIYPENEEDVLDALQSALGVVRQARVS